MFFACGASKERESESCIAHSTINSKVLKLFWGGIHRVGALFHCTTVRDYAGETRVTTYIYLSIGANVCMRHIMSVIHS